MVRFSQLLRKELRAQDTTVQNLFFLLTCPPPLPNIFRGKVNNTIKGRKPSQVQLAFCWVPEYFFLTAIWLSAN